MRTSTIVAVVTCAAAISFGALCLTVGLLSDHPPAGSSLLGSSAFMVPGIVSVILGTVGLILTWGTRNFRRTGLISVCVAVGVGAVVIITSVVWWLVMTSGFGSA
jgi:hypothetical protein